MTKQIISIFILLFVITYQGSGQEIVGKWYSKTVLDNKEVHYLIDIRANQNEYVGYLDIPADNTFRIKLDSISFSNHKEVTFKHKGLKFLFEGTIHMLSNEILGIVYKDSLFNSLSFSRTPQVTRSQTIKEPLPYSSEDIYFYNKDSIRFAGTITIPKGAKESKAVILISGSGPQNRDEEILGHKPFQILADHLTRQGIVVLRYDDRGYGESQGTFRPATSLDYTYDALGALDFLNNYEKVSLNKIGLIGHSEGGNIAPVVATKDSNVAFLVLLAAPAPSNLASYLVSLDLILKEYPETYDRDFPFFKSVYEDMAKIEDKKILKDSLTAKFTAITKLMNEEELSIYGGPNNYIQSHVDSHVSDWYHYYLRFDVTKYLAQLSIPILALNGDKDNSVEADFNLSNIEAVLSKSKKSNFEIVKLKNVNHFFQSSKDDKIQSVYFNEETFSKEALEIIGNWIKKL